MPESIRSFIAFDIDSDPILKKISDAQRLLAETGADLKLVEPKNIHITLRFLGNVTTDTAEKVFTEMKKVQFTPFKVKIQGLGAFPNAHRPRVLWARITEGANQLTNIFDQLEPNLRRLGFAPDPKGFSPHLTIARVRSEKNKYKLAEFLLKNSSQEFGVIIARCLKLKRSDLTPRGPIYSTLKEHCLQSC
ncbi:MAG: RNA 2',3'-cyclic phosphodiesterase [Candidatus Bathyarchaeota archaeon]|nr:RNA 2',3'-cyclic phosphodiesterase [Candidatus Bathyarchaeota archaeon]